MTDLEVGVVHHPDAASDHLLEVGPALDRAHEQQTLQRLHIGPGGDHVDRDNDPRVERVAEQLQQILGLAVAAAIGDLGGEIVALTEDFADHLHDVVGMGVVLGEDQCLGYRRTPREQLREELLLECRENSADLVRRHHCAVELPARVLDRFIHRLPSELARHAVAIAGELTRLDLRSALGDRGLDDVDREVHVHAVRDRQLVAVLHHEVLAEKAKRLLRRRRCQPDQVRVEVLEHLPPHPIDRAVALIDDDHIERVRRKLRVVLDRDRLRYG